MLKMPRFTQLQGFKANEKKCQSRFDQAEMRDLIDGSKLISLNEIICKVEEVDENDQESIS